MFFYCTQLVADDLDCQRIYMAGTGEAAGKIRRYVLHSSSSCVFVQTLRSRVDGSPVYQDGLCWLEGKSLSRDFADVGFNNGEFHGGKLYFEVSVTPRIPMGEEIKLCEVVFINGRAHHFKCEDGKSMGDVRRSLYIDDYY
ncbi:hypothetical protein [Pseudomonas sp. zfem002]|uniref:hypothetical protein n=1 Tax=Pseudomonas sp. zfem002 TaxID=3078197 RepID=UPI002929D8C1|nr:hypothetical protein [Pseudomonas sp. zfem002]MDU9393902.1 hypothetical protein [Pseudomonas sp. zfem002]